MTDSDSCDQSSSSGGRPETPFSEASDRSKRRKTESLRATYSTQQLCYASKMSLRSSGAVTASKIVEDVALKSPERAEKYSNALKKVASLPTLASSEGALSLLVEAEFTRYQYDLLRASLKQHNCKIYPAYDPLLEAKKQCYPKDITVTEISAEVKLQSLLNHTCYRIILLQRAFIRECEDASLLQNLCLVVKWGFDGSSGHSEYKQKFSDENASSSDCSVLLTSLVPLKLSSNVEEMTVWQNLIPSSPRFCRPIRIQFKKETTELSIKERDYIEDQIKSLKPCKLVIDGIEVCVNFQVCFTMIDGKVNNAVTGTRSAMCCSLCGETSKYFNDIDAMLRVEINASRLQYGLSTLHCWIRFMECLLKVARKSVVGKWKCTTEKEKQLVLQNKNRIIGEFGRELGLIVDCPKPGCGSSNDGNTARPFFRNSSVTARILRIDESIIRRFHVILQL